MTPNLPHLIIREGPERGRELIVPAAGARMGRSSENDLVLQDPALSRFQCRLFFKDDRLHVLDLGSTNQTLVNNQPVSEQPLRPGDEILIGEMTLRVLSDRLDGTPPPPVPAPVPAPRPPTVTVLKPAAVPAVATTPSPAGLAETNVDLGFRKARDPESGPGAAGGAGGRKHAPGWLWAIAALALLALGIAAIFKYMGGDTPPTATAPKDPPEKALALRLEKVEADARNVFRYHLTLEEGRLAVEIDDLRAGRKVTKEKQVSPVILADLLETLRKEDFFGLSERYEGLSPDFHDQKTLQVTLGRQTLGVTVLNRIEPPNFKEVRETIEEFAESELGLEALSLPPEELTRRGQNAFLLGQKLYGERNSPKHDNLWNAIKAFTEVEIYLESVEPKPAFFPEAMSLLDASRRDLKQRVEDYDFKAQQNIKLREWEEAARTLRIIMETVPDRTDERHAKAFKELLSVERNLGPGR
jgi:hypothetical protein